MAIAHLLSVALFQAAVGGANGASDSVAISGPMPLTCSASFSEQRIVVDINSRGPQSLGTITYLCNSANGIVRRVSSENGGALTLDNYRIPYRMEERGSDSLGFAFRDFSAPLIAPVAAQEALVNGVTDELRVMIPALPAGLVAGEYTDTITVEISPN